MRTFTISVFVAVLASSTMSLADDRPGDLRPRPIDLQWNAGALARQCADELKDCNAFCKNPLDTQNAIPRFDQKCDGTIKPDEAARLKSDIAPTAVGWQAKVLEGIAAFLVQRAKAEALATLVHHMGESICENPTGRLTMPATCGLLGGVDPYVDPVGWSALRAAFQTDLRELPKRLVGYYVQGDKAEPLMSLLEIIKLLESGSDAYEVLAGLQDKYETIKTPGDCRQKPFSCSLRTLGFLAEILQAPITKPTVADQERYAKIALRLVYERTRGYLPASGELLTNAASFEQAIKDLRKRFDQIQDRAAEAVKAMTDFAKSPEKALLAYDNYSRAAAAAVSLVGLAAFESVASKASRLGIDAKGISEVVDHLTLALEAVRNDDYAGALVETLAALQLLNVQPPSWVTKYGSFVATVATAKTSDDVQKALESAAAPVGAWRAKRGSDRHALTINAYVGLQGGFEWLAEKDVPDGRARQFGLFAPIGLEYSWGFAEDSSLGLFLSVIDLGALVDVRESTSGTNMMGEMQTVDTTSTLGFRQVFSPGLYGVWGLGLGKGGVPLSLGVGGSISPQLRSVNVMGGTTTDVNAVRAMAFLAIDITIFGL